MKSEPGVSLIMLAKVVGAVIGIWVMWPVTSAAYCDRFGWFCEYIAPVLTK